MDLSITQALAVLGAGALGGFINTMAGGGSFVKLIALEYAGLPLDVANGTNRVAVETGALMALFGFKKKGVGDWRRALHFAIPALLGAILGARIAANMPVDVFKQVLAVVMILMLFTLIFDTKKIIKEQAAQMTGARRWVGYLVFFAIGVYGGAIQAGVGFLFIAALVLIAGEDLVRTTYFKVFAVATYTIVALATFALNGQVNWVLGLILAAGTAVGGWIASQLAAEKGQKAVKIVLAIVLAFTAARYLGLIPGL